MAGRVKRRIFIECGVAETRAAVLVDGEPLLFWFGPARGDEKLPRPPQSGDIFAGRVRTVSKPLGGAFVDIGAASDGFLPFGRKSKPLAEGGALIVRVRRHPIGEKGAVLSLNWQEGLHDDAKAAIAARARTISVGALGDIADAALQPLMRFDPVNADIAVNDPAARQIIENLLLRPVQLAVGASQEFSIDQAIAESLEQRIAIAGGARLIFHETEAGALIDVDSASASSNATGILADKTNLAAAARLFSEISRRAISGRVIVDFLPPSGAAARATLAEQLAGGLNQFPRARFGKLSPDGLCDVTMPREHPSLLEFATEPAGGPRPIPGRRFTLDWSAKSAIRALERDLLARRSAQPRLLVGQEIGDYLSRERPQWSDRLEAKFGARFTVVTKPSMDFRDHEVVE